MRKQIYNEFLVEVTPREPFLVFSPEVYNDRMKRDCEDIAKSIRKHVDGVAHVRCVVTRNYACDHCGYAWTEDGDDYNGGCCDEDEKHNPEHTP